MKIREWRREDIDEISKIWEENYSHVCSLPHRKHSIIDAVVTDKDKVIAYGQVRHFAELMLFLEPNISKRKKILALKALMDRAFFGINKVGLDQCYAFIHDPDFALLIEKHFGFSRIDDPGELLMWSEL